MASVDLVNPRGLGSDKAPLGTLGALPPKPILVPMRKPQTDSELIKASLDGQMDAFGTLVERYQNLVCSVAFSSTGNLALADDVAQETFVAAWKQLADIQ